MRPTVLLSIPGLRESDIALMPNLSAIVREVRPLVPTFPAVTCPTQSTLTTGVPANEHGVIANGFYWPIGYESNLNSRPAGDVEMWTAWADVVSGPRIWDRLKDHDSSLTSAVWFPMLAKGVTADYVCTPAPIHNPDGSESLWCYTKPTEMYGVLRDKLGHFPLQNFWGPMASIASTDWIIDSAVVGIAEHKPAFSYIYLTHLDYAAQKFGPDSDEAIAAVKAIDDSLRRLFDGVEDAHGEDCLWVVASEYAITPVERVVYPNRLLREAGFLSVDVRDGLEHLVPGGQKAWALCDHQFAHVYVKDAADVEAVRALFESTPGIEMVQTGAERGTLDHKRSGDIVLTADADAWFAYYFWLDDAVAPPFARQVDIHRKPGYDPVEMFVDPVAMKAGQGPIPLDATLVKGSHGRGGVPAVIAASDSILPNDSYRDTDVASVILKAFGVSA